MTFHFQSFRHRTTSEVVQIQAHLHPKVQQLVILWRDIHAAFPGIANVYYGTEGKELEITVKEESHYYQPFLLRGHTVNPSGPPINIFPKQGDMSMTVLPVNTISSTDKNITQGVSSPTSMNSVEQSIKPLAIDDGNSFNYPEEVTQNSFQVLDIPTENDTDTM
ncbi:hypothetical protein FBU30_006988 [Linnemannia zychae]|nr:hypothetical protein FBU30_006988 [Linnemannia zychae]